VPHATTDIDTTIREIILERLAAILIEVYNETISNFSPEALSAHLAFKADSRLNDLRLALERMDRDEYGRCIFCKGQMSEELLRKHPTAHFCEQCTGILKRRTSSPVRV
jgi:RNA polymerase-binding transcription factor DksA